MKTDQEYVREAIGLAEGWSIHVSEFGTEIIVPPFLTPEDEGHQGWSLENAHKGIIAALASQLTDQVDATDRYSVATGITGSTVHDHSSYEPITSSGPDRRMNTIRAIVDSRVLVEEES